MPSIADFWVELHTEGAEDAQAKLTGIQKVAKAVEESAKKMTGTFEKMGEGIKKSFLGAQAAVAGFAVAGFAGTVEGERLGFQMQQLSREIASVFLPAMEKLIDYVRQTVDWFRGLSSAQQDNLMKWGLWVAGATAGVKALSMFGLITPIATAATWALTAALNALGATAVATSLKTQGIGAALVKAFSVALLNPMVAAVVAVVAVTAALTTMLIVMGRAASLGEKLAQSMKRMKNEGFTEKEIEKSRVASHVQDPEFSKKSKEQQQKELEEMEQQAKDRLAIAQGYVDKGPNAKAEFKKNVADGKVGEEQASQALADVEIAQKMQKQLKDTGAVDPNALVAGSDKRSVTPTAGGIEGLQSTYGRIQEGINKSAFDPSQAHNEVKDLGQKQLEALKEVVVAVKGVNVGVGN